MRNFWQDLRFGIRMLAKNFGFTLVTVLTLTAGIGANTAIFSVVNSFLFKPLPVKNADRLVVVAYHDEKYADPHEISNPDYEDFKTRNKVFSDMTAYLIRFAGLSADNHSQRVLVTYVKGNYFSALGIQPEFGRVLLPDEGQTPGADPVAVLDYAFWKRRFNGDPSIVGKTVDLNGRPVTIVGIAPKKFFGTFYIVEPDLYAPMGLIAINPESTQLLTDRNMRQVRSLALLKPGITGEHAQAALQVIADNLEKEYPSSNRGLHMDVIPENLARPEPSAAAVWPLIAGIFLALVGLVLIVTCVNVANLLLARASIRAKEMAVRAALGAGRVRLFRQMLTESVLLAALGGLGGAGLGVWLMKWIETIRIPGDFPMRTNLPFDWRVFLYVAGAAMAAGLLAGLVPAWRAARADLNDTLRESGRSHTDGVAHHRIRNALVIAQTAGSLVVLVMAGLFIRSLERVERMELGFNPKHVLDLTIDVSQLGYDEARGKNFYRQLMDQVRTVPGVESASLAYSVPMGYYSDWSEVWKEGQEGLPPAEAPRFPLNKVGSDYFRTMEIQIVQGRAIGEQDQKNSPRVAVINETMARNFWPGENPIGHYFHYLTSKEPPVEVVGVARDGKYIWIAEDPTPYFYVSVMQDYSEVRALQVRTQLPTAGIANSIEAEVHALDPNLPVFDVMSLEDALQGGNGFFLIRTAAVFAGALGGLGLLLAVVGLYGVISYVVSQQSHEIGIRIALGAPRASILAMVLTQGAKLVLVGLLIGVMLSAALARFVESLLINTGKLDPVAYVVAAALLIVVSLVACFVPAHRAMRVDPLIVLRYE